MDLKLEPQVLFVESSHFSRQELYWRGKGRTTGHHIVNVCHVRVRKRINNIKFIGQLLVFCSKSLFSMAIDQKIVKEDLWIASMTFPTFPPFCRKSLKYRRCACSGPLSDFGSQVDSAEWRWITFFTRPFYLKKFPKSGVKNPMHCCIVFVHIVSWWWPPCLWLVAKSGLNSLNVTNCTSSAGSKFPRVCDWWKGMIVGSGVR